jgi:hypothetical protein
VRTALRSLLTVGVLLFTSHESDALTVGDLYRFCTSSDQALATMCGLYMSGFMSGLSFQQTRPQTICLPEDITGRRVKQAFEGFMRDYPKLQTAAEIDQISIIVGLALIRAFPCPKASGQ